MKHTAGRIKSKLGILTAALVMMMAAPAALACRASPADAAAGCTVSSILVNSCRPWFGAAAAGNPGIPGETPAPAQGLIPQYDYLEQTLIGNNLDILRAYDNCTDSGTNNSTIKCNTGMPFAPGSSQAQAGNQAGTYVDMNWRPASDWADAGGGNAAVNAEIKQVADNIKQLSNDVFLTVWHEPNAGVSAWDAGSNEQAYCSSSGLPKFGGLKGTAGTPAQYIAMWQNVENIFNQEGVTNVVWAYDVQGYAPQECLDPILYPGSNLVDWVLYDSYAGSTKSFASTAGATYNYLASNPDGVDFSAKPWGLGEFNDCNDTDQSAIQYFNGVKAAYDSGQYPNLEMYIIYADTGNNSGTGCLTDYGPQPSGGGQSPYEPDKQAAFNSLADDILGVSPATTAPTTPANLTATATGPNEIDLSWTASTDSLGVAGYYVYRGGTQIANVTNGTSYADTGLADATTYQYTVAAYDTAGNVSAQSSPASATTPDSTPPSVPTNLQASIQDNALTLTWTASTDNVGVAGYYVYRNGTQLGSTASTSYADTTAAQASTYQYTVAAYDAAGNVSAQTAPITVQLADTTPPSAPNGLTATAASPTQINLSWTAATDNVGVTGYDVYRGGQLIATLGNVTSYQDTKLSPATAYTYAVAAFDAAGNLSDQSQSASATTLADTTPPTQPKNLKLTPGTKSMTLKWTASTDNVGVTGYLIYCGSALIATVSGTITTYTETGLTSGKSYSYHIIAFDAAGNRSKPSATVSAKAK